MKVDRKRSIQRLLRRVFRPPQIRRLSDGHHPVFLPATYGSALRSLQDRDAFRDYKVLKRLDDVSFERVHPEIIGFWKAMKLETRARGLPFCAFELWRSPERQDTLFRQGVTRARAGSSPHQYGCAVDIVHARRFWDLTRKEWALMGAIGKEIARRRNLHIVWGGDFKSLYDPAHWELRDWRSYRKAERYANAHGVVLSEDNMLHRFCTLDEIIKSQRFS